MTRDELKKLATQTIEISNNHFYDVNGKMISFSSDKNIHFYEGRIDCDITKRKNRPADICVMNESTVNAVYRIKDNSLGVLNFASAKHPGGGFIVGSMAQEECLAYCSDLYVQQWPAGRVYYDKHNSQNNPFYSHTMFVNDVTFFRDADFNLVLQPRKCKVLTSAAVNMGVALNHGKSKKEGNAIMKTRMRKILDVFIDNNCNSIVLGAFGCGVFGNSAQDIAMMWRDLIYDEDYLYYFDEICFSVIDSAKSNNYQIFQSILG